MEDNNSNEREYIGSPSFAISARVALQLGRESISSSIVAILELVKNAYDADADIVHVRFFDLDTNTPSLIIDDDGNGMTREALEQSWMVIGTDNKLVSQRSKRKRRVLTGEKGLGRLGLDRLCQISCIQTFTETSVSGLELRIDWRKYEDSSERLETITHELFRIPRQMEDPVTKQITERQNGTRLILYGLKDDWDHDATQSLARELALLVSPFAGVKDFSIWISSGMQWQDVDGRIGAREMLEAAEWTLKSELAQDSADPSQYRITHAMSSPTHEAVFEFSEPWSEVFREGRQRVPQCGPVSFEMYFIPRQEVPSLSLSKTQIERFLSANQGIRIYRDGFRVKPYGDPSGEGDWLGLSLRRTISPGGAASGRVGSWKVGYNQVVGAVFISREANASLLDQTNREGIVEGPAYFDLRKFALHATEFFEASRQRFEIARAKPKNFEKVRDDVTRAFEDSSTAAERLRVDFDNAVSLLEDTPEAAPAVELMRGIVKPAIDQVVQKIADSKKVDEALVQVSEEQQEELQRQKDTLGNLASLGIMAATFSHETLRNSNLIRNNSVLLARNVRMLMFPDPDVHKDILQNVADIDYGASRIETFAHFTLGNLGRDKRQRTRVDLAQVIKQVFKAFSTTLTEDHAIKVELDLPGPPTPILAFHIDWESIVVNLIANAVWALEDTSAGSKCIRVRLHSLGDRIKLSFADSGRGLEAGSHERIFEPTFSTRRNRRGDIIGTGMGLAIVSSFVESYGGEITVESPSDLGGAQFHILVPVPNSAGRGQS